MLPVFTMPSPGAEPTDRSYPRWRDWYGGYTDRVFNYLKVWIGEHLANRINTLFIGLGPDIVAGPTVTVSNMIHRVVGTAAIVTINQPTGQGSYGPVCLHARDGFTTTTGGNIQVALTVGSGHAAIMFFSPLFAAGAGGWTGVTS